MVSTMVSKTTSLSSNLSTPAKGFFMEDLNKNLNTKINNIKKTNENELDNNQLIEQKKFKKSFCQKLFSKEVILYVVFGALTTLVNIGSFYVLSTFFGINSTSANNIARVLAVLVAYVTNKDLVFHSEAQGFGEKFIEFSKFILGRLFTMFIESFGGTLLFNYAPFPIIVSKCLITIIVIILNFFISKFFAFKSNKNDN